MAKAKKDGGGKIFLNSIIYTISGLLMKCFSFFLLPLYTAYLTTEDYGITAVASSFTAIMGFVVAFSLYSAASRFYFDYKDDSEKLKRFYGTLVTFIFMSGVVFSLVLIACKGLLLKYIFPGIDFYPVVFVCIISLTSGCLHTLYDSILRSRQQALKCSLLTIATFFVTLVLNILFVVVMKLGALGTLLATLIAQSIYTIYFVIDMLIHREIRFGINGGMLKSSLKYSIPLLPHNLSANLSILISKLFIGNVVSLASVGIYNVATQFGNMSDAIQGYVSMAYGPWLIEKLQDKGEFYKREISNTTKLLCSVIGVFLICLALFSQDCILLFLSESYSEAWRYVPLIVGIFSIKTIYYFHISVLFYYKKASKFIFIATLSGSILNILLSAWLIPIFGVYGSILADAIAMAIRVSIIVFISKHYEDTGLKLKDMIISNLLLWLFVGIGLLPSYIYYGDTFSVENLVYKVGVVFIYMIFVGYPHRKVVGQYLRNIKNKIWSRIGDSTRI